MDQLNSTEATSIFSSSSPGPIPHPCWDSSRLVPAVVLSICFILGVPGNIAVMILRPNWQHLSSLSQSLMLNLAVSDLICLMTLPVWIYVYLYSWTFSLVVCKFLAYIEYCSIYGSLLTVTGLSVQRYLVVVHQQRWNQIHKRLLLVLLWLVAFILSTPSLVVRQITTDQGCPECRPQYSSKAQQVASLITETVFGFVSLVLVAFSYIQLKKKIKQAIFFNNPQTTRLVTSIIISLFVLWVPYHTINVLRVAAISLKNKSLLKFCTDMWNIAAAVTFINSCLNPLLYGFTSHRICIICQKKKTEQHDQRNYQATAESENMSDLI